MDFLERVPLLEADILEIDVSKKILVLGATRTVDKPLVEGLLVKGEAAKAASRANRRINGAEGMPFDFGKPGTVATTPEGVGRTYMFLPVSYLNLRDLLLPFVEAAVNHKVKIVLQSAFGVDADDVNPMRQMEIPLEKSGTPHVILRPNWFLNNFHRFWKADLDQGQIALPTGDSRTSSIDMRDIVTSAITAPTSTAFDSKTFDLTGPEASSYADIAAILSGVIGESVQYTAALDKVFTDALENNGVPAVNAVHMVSIFHPVHQDWVSVVTNDVMKLTGKRPRTLREYTQDKIIALTVWGQAATPWTSRVGGTDQRRLGTPAQPLFFQAERETIVSMQFSKDHYQVCFADTPGGRAIDNVVAGVTPWVLAGLGNLISVTLPNVDRMLTQGVAAAETESDKAVTNLYTPVSGEIIAANTASRDTPTLVNTGPLDAGWFFRVKLNNPG